MAAADIAIPLTVALAFAALVTPLVIRFALRTGIVDRPNERSVSHRDNMPLLGGLAVAAGSAVGLLVAIGVQEPDFSWWHFAGLAAGSLVILGIGIWDDRYGLGALPKFAGQLAAAAIAIQAGFQVPHLTEPISRHTFFFTPGLMWVASLLWIVGITNALNLIDGLDGLATGVGAIICLTLTVILAQAGQPFGVCLGVALLGGLLGFLPFNFPPARIFLGDTGSLFIGYSLALLALEGYRSVNVITFVVPLLALAVPILDTAMSIVRRAREGRSPFRADRLHIHHRLLARRGSPRAAVLQFYFLTACFSLIAWSFTDLHGIVAGACLVVVFVLTLRLLSNLGVLSLQPGEELAVGELPGVSNEDGS